MLTLQYLLQVLTAFAVDTIRGKNHLKFADVTAFCVPPNTGRYYRVPNFATFPQFQVYTPWGKTSLVLAKYDVRKSNSPLSSLKSLLVTKLLLLACRKSLLSSSL